MNQEELRDAFYNVRKNKGKLVLGGKHFVEADFVSAVSALPPGSLLQTLQLDGTRVGDAAIREIIRHADKNDGFLRLRVLHLDSTRVGDAAFREITRHVAKNEGFAHLDVLSLRKTLIGDAGIEELARYADKYGLPKLRVLALNATEVGNKGIQSFADAAANHGLPKLEIFSLGGTRVGNEGVEALAKLAEKGGFPKVRRLDLSNTQIRDEGVEALAGAAAKGALPRLQYLSLGYTQVGNKGVEALAKPAAEKGLSQLQGLFLDRTQVGNKGVDALAQAVAAQGFKKLQYLSLFNTRVMVAVEELATYDPQRIFQALKGATIAEAKVVLLGEPRAGKSWLCQRFFRNRVPSNRQETHGFELLRSRWKPRVGALDIDLRVWDFGGQHVLHGTHEMFLAQRSIAILVLDVMRSLQDNRAEYWLKLICHCAGPDTPTIVVVSKCDGKFLNTKHQICQAESARLKNGLAQPPQVVESFSALAPRPQREQAEPTAVEALRSAVETALQQIEDIHKTASPASARMKSRVEREMKGRSLVPLTEYQRWCREEEVDDRDQSILRTLHNFGSAFFFGLTERERRLKSNEELLGELPAGEQRLLTAKRDSILDKWIVNPHWLMWPIYQVIRESENRQRKPKGVMTTDEIAAFAKYGDSHHGVEDAPIYICKLLELNGVCLQLPLGKFLFPGGLDDGEPYGCDKWPMLCSWKWEFLPENAFHRFVVRMHERGEVVKDSKGNWQHWRSSVVIEHPRDSGCRAVIFADSARGRIEARVDEQCSTPPKLFSDLQKFVDDLFENEIVKRPASAKQLSGIDVASPRDIIAGIKGFVELVYKDDPNRKCKIEKRVPTQARLTRARQVGSIHSNGLEGKGKCKLDIDSALEWYSKYLLDKFNEPLDPDDRGFIKELVQREKGPRQPH